MIRCQSLSFIIYLQIILFVFSPMTLWCEWNNPYPKKNQKKAIIYNSFSENPKTLDPAASYTSNEWAFLCQLVEPPLQYHYLKRPYQLIPLTAQSLPKIEPCTVSNNGNESEGIKYTLTFRQDVYYQNHPCFVKNGNEYLYHLQSSYDFKITSIFDFPQQDTRKVIAKDYLYQIFRIADDRNQSPIQSLMFEKILGLEEASKKIREKIEEIRQERIKKNKENGNLLFDREEDEKRNPIIINYFDLNIEGVKVLDEYTLEITLKDKYPQFKYWLATPFFCPTPWEAVHFFEQYPLKEAGIKFSDNPVGSGPYRLDHSNRNATIILTKNENYHDEFYPKEASSEFNTPYYLKHAGAKLPLTEQIIFSKEPEVTTRWIKFMQGYYDYSAIPEENFASSMDFSSGGDNLSKDMMDKGIHLMKSSAPVIFYTGFNMLDPTIGGYTPEKKKLRQAISIALDSKEFIQIFQNNRGMIAHGPIPPEIFGYTEGKTGYNPFVFNWNEEKKIAERKSLEEAKMLLKEAGYEGGINPETGEPLVIRYDAINRSGNASKLQWYRDRLLKLGIIMQIEETDYSLFQEKVDKATIQMFSWGWSADYPDPENFLFLFYSPNGKAKFKGENAVNYENKTFDNLFEQIKSMEDSPQRLEVIQKALHLLREDAPWDFSFFKVSYVLYHDHYENLMTGGILKNDAKYHAIDLAKRNQYIDQSNEPEVFWFALIIIGISIILLSTFLYVLKKEMN